MDAHAHIDQLIQVSLPRSWHRSMRAVLYSCALKSLHMSASSGEVDVRTKCCLLSLTINVHRCARMRLDCADFRLAR